MSLYPSLITASIAHANRMDEETAASNPEYAADDERRRRTRAEDFMGHLAGLMMSPPCNDPATADQLFDFLDFTLDPDDDGN